MVWKCLNYLSWRTKCCIFFTNLLLLNGEAIAHIIEQLNNTFPSSLCYHWDEGSSNSFCNGLANKKRYFYALWCDFNWCLCAYSYLVSCLFWQLESAAFLSRSSFDDDARIRFHTRNRSQTSFRRSFRVNMSWREQSSLPVIDLNSLANDGHVWDRFFDRPVAFEDLRGLSNNVMLDLFV